MIEAVAALAIGAIIFVVWSSQRATERREKEWALERNDLLTRIQAPERVVDRRIPEPSEESLFVPSSDEAWEEYLEQQARGEVV